MPVFKMLYRPDLMTCQHEYGTHNHIWCILPTHRLECRHPSLDLFPLKKITKFLVAYCNDHITHIILEDTRDTIRRIALNLQHFSCANE